MEPLENLTNCEEAIRAFEQAHGLVLPRAPPPPPSHAYGGVAPPLPPAGVPWSRALVTSVQSWWAGAFCTGGRPTAGNLEPSRVSAHLPPPALLTWWPTPGKPRRYAERWTLLPMGNAGCCFPHWHLLESSEFSGGTASWSRRPDLGIKFGLCSVTGSTRP